MLGLEQPTAHVPMILLLGPHRRCARLPSGREDLDTAQLLTPCAHPQPGKLQKPEQITLLSEPKAHVSHEKLYSLRASDERQPKRWCTVDLLTDARQGQPRSAAQPSDVGLIHEALFYRDQAAYTIGVTRFVREGFELDEPVLVAVPGSHVDMLRAVIGPKAEQVQFVDMVEAGRNPGRIIPAVLYAFCTAHPQRRVRIVGESIWSGRSAAEYRAVLQHEALINIALAGHQATILCPYHRHDLDATTLAQARQTHPVLVEEARRELSADYRDPRAVADESLRSLPDPPEWWGDMLVFRSLDDLRGIRRFVEDRALRVGLQAQRVTDLCLAVNEVATNTLVHTRAAGVLSLWQESETGNLVCEISDSGQLTDRLIGRIPPARSEPHGRGLLLVNELCDLVEIPTGRIGTGTTVRLHMRLW
jgi:anti-sigma regulatory factor (Ser/Thr protein kinase)